MLQFLLHCGKRGFEVKLHFLVLIQKCLEQFYYLCYRKLPVFGFLCIKRVDGILVTGHPVDILLDALACLFALCPNFSSSFLQLILQHHIEVGLENIPKYLLPLAGFRLQQLAEIAL